MAMKPLDLSPDDEPSADTINLEQQSIMETAEFKALLALADELFGDDEGPETAEASAENDDLLSITDHLEKLRVIDDEEDSGFSPYDNGEQK